MRRGAAIGVMGWLLVSAGATFSQTGALAGRITLSSRPAARANVLERGVYRGAKVGTTRQAESLSEQYKYLVVYLTGAGLPAGTPPTAHATLQQRDVTFLPHIVPILRGTTVDFPNSDKIYHNVFSYSKPHKFDLGRYSQGETRSVTFDAPGIVRVFCEIHAHMSAVILVLENPYFTLTEDGRPYLIADVPPGSYTMTVWHEHLPEKTLPVIIAAGDTTRMDAEL